MSRETFQNSAVVSYLNDNFISIRVNTDNDRKTAAFYNTKGVPVSWFLKTGGEKIGSSPGFIPPERMLEILQKI